MPPMEKDSHEEILSKLLDSEITHDEKTDLLQRLRVDYDEVLEDTQKFNDQIGKLEKDNKELVVSNSQMFRQLGFTKEKEKEEDEKNYSETITISDLEKQI